MADEDIDPELQNLLNEIEEAEIAGATEAELPDEPEKPEPESEKPESEKPESEKSEDSEEEITQEEEIDKQLEELGLDPDDLKSSKEEVEENIEEDVDNPDPDIDEDTVLDVELVEDDELSKQRAKLQKDVLGMVTKHFESSEKMFEEAEIDRKRAEEIINIVLPRIEADNYKAADIQTIAALLQTKADISRNRSSMMDSISRLLAAIKNNPSVEAKSGGGESFDKEELKRLLGGGPK